jgi:hypothetical protein
MTGSGLRRFVRPAAPVAAGSAPAASAPPANGAGADQAVTAEPAPPGQLPTSAQDAVSALPPLMADLLAAAPGPGAAAPGMTADGSEKCELCATWVPAEHGHVADLETSSLVCACRACYLLFTRPGALRSRYRAVPDRYLHDPARPLGTARWDQLEIPVGLVFFLASSVTGQVTGFYPSPAGATECVLDLAAWEQLTGEFPLLGAAQPDVEAALVCRVDSGMDYFVVPIDACYELAGRMRLYWRGFDGGAEARQSIAEFLDRVRSRATAFSSQA